MRNTVQIGCIHEDVRTLHQMLNRILTFEEMLAGGVFCPPLQPDTFFGINTARAVLIYRGKKKIFGGAVVDSNLWQHLESDYQVANQQLPFGAMAAALLSVEAKASGLDPDSAGREPIVNDPVLTIEDLAEIAEKGTYYNISSALVEQHHQPMNKAMREFEIITPYRIAAFLGNVLVETGGLRYFVELGGDEYFKKYDKRGDLGNKLPGDGARYKGRGAIQLTGRANYTEASIGLGLDLVNNPGLLETLENGWRVGGYFWHRMKNLNIIADKGPDSFRYTVFRVRGSVQGAATHWDRRVLYYKATLGALDIPIPGEVPRSVKTGRRRSKTRRGR